MDLTTHQSYEPMMVIHSNEHVPEMEEKYSQPPYVYKHVYEYMTTPEVTTHVEHKKKKKIKTHEDSWMDYLNPFGCNNDDYYDDYDYAY